MPAEINKSLKFIGCNMKKNILLVLFLLFAAGIVKAQTIDDFNYAGNLTSNGWSAHSGSGTNAIATTAGLTYAGYINSAIGNAALINNLGGEDINFTAGIGPYNTNGSKVYTSFLVRITEGANKTGDYFFNMGNRTNATSFSSFAARMFAKVNAGVVNFGISNTSTATYGTTAFATNTTYLVVIKYSINTGGNDQVDMWILPAGVPYTEANAGAPEVSNTTTSGTDIINAIALRQGSNTTQPQSVVDGIRVATTWADVLFVPSVSTGATGVGDTMFTANWGAVSGVTGYQLDVATDAAFTSFVAGYNNKDVGNVTSYNLTGLTAGQTYYYRVRAYNASFTGGNSASVSLTTVSIVLSATEAGALAYTEGDPATAITATTSLASSAANLAGAVFQITSNYRNGEDVLAFTNANGITGSWDASTGKLTLTGTTTSANYQTAVRSVTYQNTSQNPGTLQRTVSFSVNDGTTSGNTVTRNITVAAVNNAPVLAAIEGAALSYNTGAGVAITSSTTLTDPDNANMTGAVVQITGNYSSGQDLLLFTNQNGISGTWTAGTGTLTLSGSASVASYQTAIRSIKFQNSSPAASVLVRTVSFTVNDGAANSNTATRNISVNNAPVLASIENAKLVYRTGQDPISLTSTTTITDSDSPNLTGAEIKFDGYYERGNDELMFNNQNGISGFWNETSGTLTLIGTSSVANYQAALRSITFRNISSAPVLLIRTVSFKVNDGTVYSDKVTRDIDLGYLPLSLSGFETNPLVFNVGDDAKAISSNIAINCPSSPLVYNAIIKITGNYVKGEDFLLFTNQNQIYSTWDANTGTLELFSNASVINYQTAIRSITYRNTSATPSTNDRTISVTVSDFYNTSNTAIRTIKIGTAKTIALSASPAEGGTVTGGGTKYTNNQVTVTAAPNAGYTFVNWTENGTPVSTSPAYTFMVSGDRSLAANFTINQYNITVTSSPAQGGTSTGGGLYNYGSPVTLQAAPAAGWVFVNWSENGNIVASSAAYTFTVTEARSLTANYFWPSQLSVDQEIITAGPGAGTAIINVSNTGGGSMNWSAVSDIFWIKINSGLNGINNGQISISYNHNNSIARVGTITITANGVSGSPKKIEIRQGATTVGIENIGRGIPKEFRLDQNYPNPFNPATKIRFGVPEACKVTVTVYNLMGEEIEKIVDGEFGAGYYEADFNANNLSSGMYLYKITAGSFVQVKKMVLTK